MKPNIQLLIWGFIVCALVTRYCNPFRCPYLCDDTKMSSVSWPRICSAGRLSLCGLIPQRSRCLLLSLSLSLSQDKKSSDNEEDLTAVRRLLFYHLSVWLFWSHFFLPPPRCCLTFSTQCKCFSGVSGCLLTSLMWPLSLKVWCLADTWDWSILSWM